MSNSATGPAIKPRETAAVGDDEAIAAYRHDLRRTIPFVVTIALMVGLGIYVIAELGISEGWVSALLFVGLPIVLVASYVRDLRLGPPLLIATRHGLIDRRRGPSLMRWKDITEANVKNRLFGKGVRIVLADGERVEVDMSLLNGDPKDLLLLMHSAAAREREEEEQNAGVADPDEDSGQDRP